jgi:hypothetical protein
MTFETENRAAVLAARARDIVLDEARSAGRWEDSTPSADPALVAAVITARTTHADDILAVKRAELARAQRVVDRWADEGWGTAPLWARSTVDRLQHLKNDDAEGVDDAIAALSAALR